MALVRGMGFPSGMGIEPSMSTSSKKTTAASVGGGGGGTMPLNRKDLSQYAPLKCLEITSNNTRLYTVPNGITDETVLIVKGTCDLTIYRLKVTENKDYDVMEDARNKLQYELIPLQTVRMKEGSLGHFTVSSNCSVTLPPRRLTYAVSPFFSTTVFYCDFKETEKGHFLPEEVILNVDECYDARVRACMKVLDTAHSVGEMALQGDKYLACILSNRTLAIWDIPNNYKLYCVFHLTSEVVHLSWHVSEPYKLFLVESNGWVKFFNVVKEFCYMTSYLCRTHLYSGDWAVSNSLCGVVGGAGGITTFNTSHSNTNLFTTHDVPCKVFKTVKFNPSDYRSIATLERYSAPGSIIRLWRDHLPNSLWTHSSDQINDIAWMYGRPYIIALGHRHVFIFDGTSNS